MTYPASWVSIRFRIRSVTSRTASGTRRRSAKARLCQAQSRPHRCHAAGPSGTVVRVGVGSQAGMSRRAALQRCGQGEVRSAVRRQLANAALSSGRTTYSHGSGAALLAQREAAYSSQVGCGLAGSAGGGVLASGTCGLAGSTRRRTHHGWDAALLALREAAYSHPKASGTDGTGLQSTLGDDSHAVPRDVCAPAMTRRAGRAVCAETDSACSGVITIADPVDKQ